MTAGSYDIKTVIDKLSGFGRYQKRNFAFISLAVAFSCIQYSYVFSTRSTKHRCLIEECESESQEERSYHQPWLANAIPFDGSAFRKCERFAPIAGVDRFENQSCSAGWFNTSVVQRCETLVMEKKLTSVEFDFELICEENLWMLTLLGSIDEIGEVIFSPFVGYFSDRWGRKSVLVNSLVLSGVFGVIKSFSPSYIIFAIMEFLTACFTSAIYGSAYILAVELLVPEQRVLGSTIATFAFPFGEIALGLAAWLSPSWQFMLRVLYGPGLLFVTYFWLLDDSLCFLVASGKTEQALTVVRRVAKANRIDVPDDLTITQGPTVQKDTSSPDEQDGQVQGQRETIFHLRYHPSLILRVFNCSFQWICCTFVYYGLTIFSVSLTGNTYVNFIIMAVIELPACVICYFLLNALGRRITLSASLLLSGAACLASGFVPEDIWIAQLILPIVGKFSATMAFKAIYIYTAEMFPTTLRHTLLAVCSMFGRAGSIAAPQLPIIATVSHFLPPLLFGILGLSAGGLAFFLPETKGCELPNNLEESRVVGRKPHAKTHRTVKTIS